jgi:hypothetical protein
MPEIHLSAEFSAYSILSYNFNREEAMPVLGE